MPTLFRFLGAAVIAAVLPAAQAGQVQPINTYGAYNAEAPSDSDAESEAESEDP